MAIRRTEPPKARLREPFCSRTAHKSYSKKKRISPKSTPEKSMQPTTGAAQARRCRGTGDGGQRCSRGGEIPPRPTQGCTGKRSERGRPGWSARRREEVGKKVRSGYDWFSLPMRWAVGQWGRWAAALAHAGGLGANSSIAPQPCPALPCCPPCPQAGTLTQHPQDMHPHNTSLLHTTRTTTVQPTTAFYAALYKPLPTRSQADRRVATHAHMRSRMANIQITLPGRHIGLQCNTAGPSDHVRHPPAANVLVRRAVPLQGRGVTGSCLGDVVGKNEGKTQDRDGEAPQAKP